MSRRAPVIETFRLPAETIVGVMRVDSPREVSRGSESPCDVYTIAASAGRYPIALCVATINGRKVPYLRVIFTGHVTANGWFGTNVRKGETGQPGEVRSHLYAYEALGRGYYGPNGAPCPYDLTTEGRALLEALTSYDSGLL